MSWGLLLYNRCKDMKRKINQPDVAVKLSIKAYQKAVKLYNQKQEQDFLNNRKDTKVKTVKALLLKEEHHQVFYTIINYYKDKLETLNDFLWFFDTQVCPLLVR